MHERIGTCPPSAPNRGNHGAPRHAVQLSTTVGGSSSGHEPQSSTSTASRPRSTCAFKAENKPKTQTKHPNKPDPKTHHEKKKTRKKKKKKKRAQTHTYKKQTTEHTKKSKKNQEGLRREEEKTGKRKAIIGVRPNAQPKQARRPSPSPPTASRSIATPATMAPGCHRRRPPRPLKSLLAPLFEQHRRGEPRDSFQLLLRNMDRDANT